MESKATFKPYLQLAVWVKKYFYTALLGEEYFFYDVNVRAHSIWPPCALALGQLTHEHLARLRIDYVASQESVMRS